MSRVSSVEDKLATAEAIDELCRAVEFLDQCRSERSKALATGAFKDAREWVEAAARGVIAASAGE